MTRSEALVEARRRWGKNAQTLKRSHLYRVGVIALGTFFDVKGQGPSWEDAFREAEKRQPKKQKAALPVKG